MEKGKFCFGATSTKIRTSLRLRWKRMVVIVLCITFPNMVFAQSNQNQQKTEIPPTSYVSNSLYSLNDAGKQEAEDLRVMQDKEREDQRKEALRLKYKSQIATGTVVQWVGAIGGLALIAAGGAVNSREKANEASSKDDDKTASLLAISGILGGLAVWGIGKWISEDGKNKLGSIAFSIDNKGDQPAYGILYSKSF